MKVRILIAIGLLAANLNLSFAQGTAFTYQGRLSSGTTGVTGLFDFRFAAFDAASSGSQVGSTVNATAVGVTNGLFTVTLDFGANVFSGASRYLDLAARTNGSAVAFVSMTPRQPLTPTPYAVLAASANTLAGTFSGDVTGTQGATLVQTVAGYSGSYLVSGAALANAAGNQNYPGTIVKRDGLGNFSAGNMNGSFTGNGAGITNLPTSGLVGTIASSQIAAGAVAQNNLAVSGTPGAGKIVSSDGTGLVWANAATISGAWALTGNAGTTPGANFIGTTDNQPLEIKASGVRSIRIEGNNVSALAANYGYTDPALAPNIIAGGPYNYVNPSGVGSAVLSGGAGNYEGKIFSNSVSGDFSTIAGGSRNSIQSPNAFTYDNFIGGGDLNTVSSNSSVAFIGGGFDNTIRTNSDFSVIVGGGYNVINGQGSFIGGGGIIPVINGYSPSGNSIASDGAVLVGGVGNNIAAGADFAFLGGGYYNIAFGSYTFVGGGYENVASGSYAVVPGGYSSTAGGQYSLAAGNRAKALHQGAFVWADSQAADFSSTANNQFSVRANGGARFVTGGAGLTVDGNTVLTTSSGTNGVTIQQNVAGSPSVILGSAVNHAASGVSGATVGGGGSSALHYTNSATADFATVSGGAKNTASGAYSVVSGGQNNTASDDYSAVVGGQNNTASGLNSAVLNGIFNNASGDYSLAAGANATASGTFSVIIGGQHNTASGLDSVILGGEYNSATGNFSLAAGEHAHAVHNGAFVWADSQGTDLYSTMNDQFLVRARGGAQFVTGGAGLAVDGNTVLTTSSYVANLTANQTFTGANTFSSPLTVATTAGQLTLQGESGVAVGIAATGGPNAGHMRFRNALEIFPASDASAPGILDVRDTNGFATITLRGDTGSLSATNISTVGNATIGGNLSANNTPGVNYTQVSYLSESISFPGNSTVNIASEGNAKVAPGFFLISASVTGLGVGNLVELDLLDVSGTPTVLTSCSTETDVSGTKSGAFSLSLNWVVPISAANGYQNFGIRVKSFGGNSGGVINGHNLSVLYVPRQNN